MQTKAHFQWFLLIFYLANICAYFGLTICLEEKVIQDGFCVTLPVHVVEQGAFLFRPRTSIFWSALRAKLLWGFICLELLS